MPKAILEFNLPEDNEAHLRALYGSDAFSILWEIDQECRKVLKYEDADPERKDLANSIRQMCWEALGKIE